jgi:uncharacterized protein (TIGR03437 family)
MQAQTPGITEVQNNYSFTNPGSLNYGIAQGSLFLISGVNFAAASNLTESFPLSQSLDGVSVAVTVNGATTNPYLYYVYAAGAQSYIAAVLPSNTPVGTGTITVTNNGRTSSPAPIQVVQTAFGIDTLYGSSMGRAVAQDATGAILSSTNAANPNQTIVLWGTGVGPDPGNAGHEGAVPQQQDNLSNLPLEVDIGGIAATIVYRGRSAYPGVDQLNVVVPPTVPTGCYVSVVVWTANYISNFATLPIAATGRTCSDAVSGYTLTASQNVDRSENQPLTVSYDLAALADSGPGIFKTGDLVLEQDNAPPRNLFGIPFPSTQVVTTANLFQFTTAQLHARLNPYLLSAGSCLVTPAQSDAGYSKLNAGPAVTVSGPTGAAGTPLGGTGSYVAAQAISFIQPPGGTYTFSAEGGTDIGAFSSTDPFVTPAFVWNEKNTMTGASRASPLTVTWSGGSPGSLVLITGFSSAAPSQGGARYFFCLAPVDAQTVTVPTTVLMSLQPTGTLDGVDSPAFLAVSNSTPPQSFSAAGLDLGLVSSVVFNSTGILTGNFFWY